MATTLAWDQEGERLYERGVDRGVLFVQSPSGGYENGVVWNGLTNVNETPTGGESNPQYADNIKYLDLISDENFEATIEAFTYPEEFEACDGTASLNGLLVSQQSRVPFAFSYRTLIGSDINEDLGYKIHVVYGAKAQPSEKSRTTVNDTPEALTFSWSVTTTPIPITGFNKPTAHIIVDSVNTDPTILTEFENLLYGDGTTESKLPTMAELATMFG